MAKKTNKTSHILDLLTNGPAPETGSPAAVESAAGSVQTHTAVPKKVTVVDEGSRNDKLSQEILNKLSEELENETRQKNNTVSGEQTAAPVQGETRNTTPQQNIPQEDIELSDDLELELESLLVEEEEDEEFHFINVMEELLKKQDLSGTFKQYNVCTCPRCNADVRALTLSALPPKYVVIGKHSFSPVLNYYENKFKIDMLTALNKACSTVGQRPHHKR